MAISLFPGKKAGWSPEIIMIVFSLYLLFLNHFKKTQNETERFSPLSIYALGKVTAYYACQLYRDIHGLKIYGAIFYNHESEVRPDEYVTRKITKAVARIFYGKQKNYF